MELVCLFLLSLLGNIAAVDVSVYERAPHRGAWQKIDDMVLSPIQTQFLYSPINIGKNVLKNVTARWLNATVPYEFDSAFSQSRRDFIEKILKEEYAKTCIVYRPREKKDTDYVRVINGSGCWSHIGRRGKKQSLSLNINSCMNRRNIAHEFLHVLGLYHQHSASNRDDYLTIKWENVDPSYKSNFVKYESDRVIDFGQPYDYNSIMHYKKEAFSSNGKPTMVAKKENVNFGSAKSLSRIDIIKVIKMYKCKMT